MGDFAMDGNTSGLAKGQTWHKVGAELRRLRKVRGVSLSGLARQVHYSTGYLSKIETGKKRITLEVARLVDEALETGGVLAALLPSPDSARPVDDEPDLTGTDACPYPGLAAFGPSETRWFFGRDQVTSDLISQLDARLAGGGPLAVVAPSGAGKSSLLAAGLIPALACGALPGSRAWPVVTATPGAHPLVALAALVAQRTGADPGDAAAATADPERFAAFLASVVVGHGGKQWETPSSARIVLIVDQFEETFTECRQEAERQAFIAALCTAAHRAGALVVLGVRADFYGWCLAYPALLTALRNPVALGPMSADQLRAIITEPAAAEGLKIEPGLVELLLRDLRVTDDPGAEVASYDQGSLPLLAHALRVTWQQRSDGLMTVAGYRNTGGIRGAIAATAERAYTRLSPSEQQIAQQILLRLVQVGDQTGDVVRRRSSRDRLLQALPGPAETTEKVLETFGRARLLTFDTVNVEITHEALLWAWPRLAEWISADRAGLRTHQLLSEATEVWEAEGRDPFLLYRGSRLAIAQDWADEPGRKAQLSTWEKAYLQASIDQKQREQQAQRRRTRRLRNSVGVLAMSLVVALVAGSIAFQQYRTASMQRHQAIVRELTANSSSLAGKDPASSMLLAVEAFHQEQIPDTRSALLSAQSQYYAGQLVGHEGILYTAIFSHDDRILATASTDGTARLWDVASHRLITTLTGHLGPVNDAAFSHDDRILATAGADGTIRLWDVASHQPVGMLAGDPGTAFSAATFSHDGRILATTEKGDDKGGTARLWDMTTEPRRQIATLNGHTDRIFSAEFSPDDRILATASADGTARLWNVASRQSLATLAGHVGRVNNATFSPDGSILATVSNDTTAKLWNVATHQPIATLIGHTGPLNSAAFNPNRHLPHDGHLLVTGSGDGTARLWDVATSRQVGTFRGYSSIIDVAFSRDGHTVATAGEDNIARLWNTEGPILISSPPAIGYDAEFSPDGRILATAGAGGSVQLWDSASRRTIADLTGHFGAVNAVAFNVDGSTLVTTGADGTAWLWDVASQRAITTFHGHAGVIRSGAFSPDGRILVTTNDGGTTQLWDITSRQPIATLAGHTGIVYTAEFSHDGRILATAGADGTTRLWDAASHQHIATLGERTGTINNLAFSPNDRILATANDDGTTQLWDVASRRRITFLRGHAGAVKSVTFSQDGHTLATTSGDTTAKLWNVDTQQLIATLAGHTDVVYGAALSPDRFLLATVGGDTTVRLWDLNENEVTARICQIIGTISEERWKGLIPELFHQPTCR
ncbi:MAG: helix-turn-helix domain-containing protein [Pseudonocardiaceae bacterium]